MVIYSRAYGKAVGPANIILHSLFITQDKHC